MYVFFRPQTAVRNGSYKSAHDFHKGIILNSFLSPHSLYSSSFQDQSAWNIAFVHWKNFRKWKNKQMYKVGNVSIQQKMLQPRALHSVTVHY